MKHSLSRRKILLAAMALPLLSKSNLLFAVKLDNDLVQFRSQLAELEKSFGGRLGIAALNNITGQLLQYRADERFPMCSTFKVVLVGALLKRSEKEPLLLQKRVSYKQEEMVAYSPITEKHIAEGMTLAELCAAALQYSDNTASNLLIEQLGGPEAVTAFARYIGDQKFRLDRWETKLNTAVPGDERDTSTPAAMVQTVQKLVLGNGLAMAQRTQLQDWLKGNTTGNQRIREAVPQGWIVGDKTGSGDYGTTNDIGVIWPMDGAPIAITVYFTQETESAAMNNEVIAKATQIILATLRKSSKHQK